jgi:hypothetical protein
VLPRLADAAAAVRVIVAVAHARARHRLPFICCVHVLMPPPATTKTA